MALDAAGIDGREYRSKLRDSQKAYTDFANQTGLKKQPARTQVAKGNIINQKSLENAKKDVAKSSKNDILEISKQNEEVKTVQHIGKLDKEIYKCVTIDIQTDDVIITDVQIQHIKERHPNDYEMYFKYAQEIIEHPDYIVEANKPNTAFILKKIIDNGKYYEMILRLHTSKDPKNYKNSVITFLKIEKKRYNRYLRTKKILYKSE